MYPSWTLTIGSVHVTAVCEAIVEMVDALREYAADWADHLAEAPNHRDNWALVQLITLGDDDQLRDWPVGTQA